MLRSDAALAKANESEASLAQKVRTWDRSIRMTCHLQQLRPLCPRSAACVQVKELEAQLQARTGEVSQLTSERDTLQTQVSDKDAALSTTTLHAQEKEAALEKQVRTPTRSVDKLLLLGVRVRLSRAVCPCVWGVLRCLS